MVKQTFEEAMERLDEIANILQQGESSLDETLELFEEGNQLVSFCEQKLKKAESKLEILSGQDPNKTDE